MRVLFVDIYAAGAEFNFVGTKHYLIAACGMTSFAVCEDTAAANSTAFAAAIMKTWLRFGFSHTFVVDKDSEPNGKQVFNRIVTLRDTWGKMEAKRKAN